MRPMAVQGDAPFLPEEIVRNILKRLPVKSLIRFQCVCIHWKNLLKTPSFVADHLHHNSLQNAFLLLKQRRRWLSLHLRLIDSHMHVLDVQNPALIDFLPKVTIIGSCNGLLCVATDEFNIYHFTRLWLWNPAIREFIRIPRTRNIVFDESGCTVGFGFSAMVNDYKIVKTYSESGEVIKGIEVYSLSTGSWKEIEFGSLEGVSLFGDTATANGSIFWYGKKRGVEEEGEDDIDLIVSFDIATEVFTLITAPPLSDNSLFQITVYEDKFAMLSLTRIGEFPKFLYSLIDLWVLEEDIGSSTARWSWTKKWGGNPCPPMLHLGTIWRNEIVCNGYGMLGVTNESGHEMENDEEKVCLYLINISTNEFHMFVVPRCGLFHDFFSYVESLTPVGNIRHEEP